MRYLRKRHPPHPPDPLYGLRAGLETLHERSRDIIQRRWLVEDKATLHELAAEYEVSAERIRQIEQAAMKKMRLQLETDD